MSVIVVGGFSGIRRVDASNNIRIIADIQIRIELQIGRASKESTLLKIAHVILIAFVGMRHKIEFFIELAWVFI